LPHNCLYRNASCGRLVGGRRLPQSRGEFSRFQWGSKMERHCGIYARTSQPVAGKFASQIDACRRYAKKEGLVERAVFTDNGLHETGGIGDGLAAMLNAARAGVFTVLLVQDVTRLSRSPDDIQHILCTLDSCEVQVFTPEGAIVMGEEGRTLWKDRKAFRASNMSPIGHLKAARERFERLGYTDVSVVAVAANKDGVVHTWRDSSASEEPEHRQDEPS
ncbi:MAG: recombinase family protein, partial [Caulobacteraceae bacterium]